MKERIFVNSDQSLSRGKVDEQFGEAAAADGSIPRAWIEQQYGPDAVLGRVEIREKFRNLYEQQTGSPIGAERARQLLQDYVFDYLKDVPVTRESSLQAWAEDKARIRAKGIATRTNGTVTDVSGGSITK